MADHANPPFAIRPPHGNHLSHAPFTDQGTEPLLHKPPFEPPKPTPPSQHQRPSLVTHPAFWRNRPTGAQGRGSHRHSQSASSTCTPCSDLNRVGTGQPNSHTGHFTIHDSPHHPTPANLPPRTTINSIRPFRLAFHHLNYCPSLLYSHHLCFTDAQLTLGLIFYFLQLVCKVDFSTENSILTQSQEQQALLFR